MHSLSQINPPDVEHLLPSFLPEKPQASGCSCKIVQLRRLRHGAETSFHSFQVNTTFQMSLKAHLNGV